MSGRFQQHQFDKNLDGAAAKMEDLFEYFERDEIFESGRGFQIHRIAPSARTTPDWAKTNDGIQKVLMTAFPKLHINKLQRQRAGRWAQVIELFFKRGWTEAEVAEAMQEKLSNIKWVIMSIARVSAGKTARGKERA